jgi:hypothetical protein
MYALKRVPLVIHARGVRALTVHRQVEIQGSLEAIATAINDSGLGDFDTARIRLIVEQVTSAEPAWTVDDGGGIHDGSGIRVGAIRRAPSGEWIIDGQNPEAARADAAIPAAAHEHREPGGDDNEQR